MKHETGTAAVIVGNLIYPRLQAHSQNIDPVTTLLALAFWNYLRGCGRAAVGHLPLRIVIE